MKRTLLLMFIAWGLGPMASSRGNESASPASPSAATDVASVEMGPTVDLTIDGQSDGNVIGDFMYFVPLISRRQVTILESKTNTQRAHFLDVEREQKGNRISMTCTFALRGEGFFRHVFDHSGRVSRLPPQHEVKHLLSHIHFEGEGQGRIEASGTMTNGAAVINHVALTFEKAPTGAQPVSTGSQSFRMTEDGPVCFDEMRMDILTLAFTRSPENPKMEVTIASIKDRGAKNSLWTRISGSVKGMIANRFIPPIGIKPIGNRAMLDFAQAIYDGQPSFQFPLAKNLVDHRKVETIP